ncbi:hypothetical protein CEXT_60001 [Caerostris extrusa]|uniref:Uncharacterized protein n=1 Tax=Caerostris extrusa TaxID=172846 RepID=A0AAV4XWG6_CAEEX|nr:hypothetical protein CEXT_60001 [Caerostris extrusa]
MVRNKRHCSISQNIDHLNLTHLHVFFDNSASKTLAGQPLAPGSAWPTLEFILATGSQKQPNGDSQMIGMICYCIILSSELLKCTSSGMTTLLTLGAKVKSELQMEKGHGQAPATTGASLCVWKWLSHRFRCQCVEETS